MDSQNNLNSPIAYCLYARKSSESDERQAMSIYSQIKEMQTLAQRDGVNIKEIRYESHSAKQSGQRPVFKELIADILLGNFSGILTWHPDRLSRNAGDLGALVDLMDQGKLQEIKTYSQSFKNQPNDKFLLMILCSQAKLENDNKGVNVKRGIRAKCEMGWRPGVAPLGYMNRAFGGVKDIVIDPERASIIQKAFELVAYTNMSGRNLKSWMDQQGFTTRTGKPITRSMTYLMLKNPFYYGHFEFPVKSGKWYKGSYKAIINKELFDMVQQKITDPSKHAYIGKNFPFKGLFKCYSCGAGICGEDKKRKLKNGSFHYHIYYHCTKSRDIHCKEPYLNQHEIMKEILRHIKELRDDQLTITDQLKRSIKNYERILKEANYMSTYDFDGELSTRNYVEYIIREGSTLDRRELIQHLPIPKRLHSKKLV
ncbi:MAG: recombinase family protein [Candidatus Roizmanbacteria bacterium]